MNYLESEYFLERIEVMVAMQELVVVFQTKSRDPAVDRFENGVAGLA